MANFISVNGMVITGNNIHISGNSMARTLRGNGEASVDNRKLEETFDKVDISALPNSTIRTGSTQMGVKLQGDSNLLHQVETVVEDGTLFVRPKDGAQLQSQTPLCAEIFLQDLTGISASASAVVSANQVMASLLQLTSSSSSKIQVEGQLGKVQVQASSSSLVRLSGQADSLSVSASSSANVDAQNLPVRQAQTGASSSARVTINASEALDARASSSGQVWYVGDPSVQRQISSSGKVSHL